MGQSVSTAWHGRNINEALRLAEEGPAEALVEVLSADPAVVMAQGGSSWLTPVHAAARGGRRDCLEAVCAAADVLCASCTSAKARQRMRQQAMNVRSASGATPLMLTTLKDNAECAALLLAAGADPTLADGRGRTVLHFCAMHDAVDVARMLLSDQATVRQREDGAVTLAPVDRDGATDIVGRAPSTPPAFYGDEDEDEEDDHHGDHGSSSGDEGDDREAGAEGGLEERLGGVSSGPAASPQLSPPSPGPAASPQLSPPSSAEVALSPPPVSPLSSLPSAFSGQLSDAERAAASPAASTPPSLRGAGPLAGAPLPPPAAALPPLSPAQQPALQPPSSPLASSRSGSSGASLLRASNTSGISRGSTSSASTPRGARPPLAPSLSEPSLRGAGDESHDEEGASARRAAGAGALSRRASFSTSPQGAQRAPLPRSSSSSSLRRSGASPRAGSSPRLPERIRGVLRSSSSGALNIFRSGSSASRARAGGSPRTPPSSAPAQAPAPMRQTGFTSPMGPMGGAPERDEAQLTRRLGSASGREPPLRTSQSADVSGVAGRRSGPSLAPSRSSNSLADVSRAFLSFPARPPTVSGALAALAPSSISSRADDPSRSAVRMSARGRRRAPRSLAPPMPLRDLLVRTILSTGRFVDARSTNGRTALHEAVSRGARGAVAALLAADANPVARTGGRGGTHWAPYTTPLHVAVRAGDDAITRALLRAALSRATGRDPRAVRDGNGDRAVDVGRAMDPRPPRELLRMLSPRTPAAAVLAWAVDGDAASLDVGPPPLAGIAAKALAAKLRADIVAVDVALDIGSAREEAAKAEAAAEGAAAGGDGGAAEALGGGGGAAGTSVSVPSGVATAAPARPTASVSPPGAPSTPPPGTRASSRPPSQPHSRSHSRTLFSPSHSRSSSNVPPRGAGLLRPSLRAEDRPGEALDPLPALLNALPARLRSEAAVERVSGTVQRLSEARAATVERLSGARARGSETPAGAGAPAAAAGPLPTAALMLRLSEAVRGADGFGAEPAAEGSGEGPGGVLAAALTPEPRRPSAAALAPASRVPSACRPASRRGSLVVASRAVSGVSSELDLDACCPICFDSEATHAVAVCGHAHCGACSLRLVDAAKRMTPPPCPICRRPIDGFVPSAVALARRRRGAGLFRPSAIDAAPGAAPTAKGEGAGMQRPSVDVLAARGPEAALAA